MPHPVLNEDWSAYDSRKISDRKDSSKFSCEEKWEVDYLVKLLKEHFPRKNDVQLRVAIMRCCQSVPAPRPREKFVAAVVEMLRK